MKKYLWYILKNKVHLSERERVEWRSILHVLDRSTDRSVDIMVLLVTKMFPTAGCLVPVCSSSWKQTQRARSHRYRFSSASYDAPRPVDNATAGLRSHDSRSGQGRPGLYFNPRFPSHADSLLRRLSRSRASPLLLTSAYPSEKRSTYSRYINMIVMETIYQSSLGCSTHCMWIKN